MSTECRCLGEFGVIEGSCNNERTGSHGLCGQRADVSWVLSELTSVTMRRFVIVICPMKSHSFVGQVMCALQCGSTALLFRPTWTLFRSAVQEPSCLKAPMSYHIGWQDELQLLLLWPLSRRLL